MGTTVLGLDVGTKRVGVAIADSQLRFANPLTTLLQDETIVDQLRAIIQENNVEHIAVGLPRGLDGQETQQTGYARQFFHALETELMTVTLSLQDEAATSIQAEAELDARGRAYDKGAIDALAATYILDDYLRSQTPISGAHDGPV